MKKLMCLIVVIILMVVAVGCGTKETTKTEEELKAEIRAEMEAEEASKEELKGSDKTEKDNATAPIDDKKTEEKIIKVAIDDKDAIFEFLKQEMDVKKYIADYVLEDGYTFNRENYDKWLYEYFDFTGDGNDDVVFFNTYYDGGLYSALFITADSGKYEIVSSDAPLAKYDNGFLYDDGFIILQQKSGGSGMGETVQNIFIYDEKEIKYTGGQLDIESYFSVLPGYCNSTGKIIETINGLKEFIFEVNKEEGNLETEEETTSVTRTKYIFDENTLTYKIEELESNDNSNPSTSNGNEEVSRVFLKDGNAYYEDEEAIYKMNDSVSDSMVKSVYFDQENNRAYYTTNTNNDNYSPNTATTYYNKIYKEKVQKVGTGEFVQVINAYPYAGYTMLMIDNKGTSNYVFYDNDGQFVCNIGYRIEDDLVGQIASAIEATSSDVNVGNKLSSFDTEIFKVYNKDDVLEDITINYSDYRLVVVPMHDTIHKDKLSKVVANFYPNNGKTTFAVFGKLEDIKLYYSDSLDATEEIENVGTVSNSYVDVYAPMTTDFSRIIVRGKFNDGEGNYKDIEFSMDDCRDIEMYGIITVE